MTGVAGLLSSVTPGNSAASCPRIKSTGDDRMPPEGKGECLPPKRRTNWPSGSMARRFRSCGRHRENHFRQHAVQGRAAHRADSYPALFHRRPVQFRRRAHPTPSHLSSIDCSRPWRWAAAHGFVAGAAKVYGIDITRIQRQLVEGTR